MRSERAVIGLVGAVQFVNILDFMMVMPLGPDFARGLGIPVEQVGVVGAAYTVAAGLTGLGLSPVLDRFDRRWALAVCMAGLAVATALGGLATGLPSLIAARVLAGAFGGPATSVALSIVADVIPVERRGKALGAVMGAFSLASVLGVPLGLEAARLASWRMPFFMVAGAGALISAAAVALLPSLTGHLSRRDENVGVLALLKRPVVWLAFGSTAAMTMSAFSVIPNISAFLQSNLGWPREHLGWLYMAGGALSFVGLRAFGQLADRYGSVPIALLGTLGYALVASLWFVVSPPPVPVWVLFPAMMIVMSARNIGQQTLLSRVPAPAERAGFQSVNSAVQHLASAAAAALGTVMLTSTPTGALVGMPALATLSILTAFAMPALLWAASRRLST